MTASKGIRAAQRRLEELLSAELTLRRVALHVMNGIAWALVATEPDDSCEARQRKLAELDGLRSAYVVVRDAWMEIAKEQKALTGR